MEDLYIETLSGILPIESGMAEKHRLKKGMLSPFTRFRIVGENGEFPSEPTPRKDPEDTMEAETEDVLMTASEVIDFSQGSDSHTEE